MRSQELIAEIKKRPCLWSTAYKYSLDKESRIAGWLEVAKALHPDFDTLSSTKKDEKLAYLKKRWKHIRDHSLKETRRSKGKKSAYNDSLRFLEQWPSAETVSSPAIHCSPQCRQAKMYKWKDLIEEVKKRPCLWGPANRYDKDKKSQETNWVEVAEALHADFETMSPEKKTEEVESLKKRWKYVRAYYNKERKSWKGKTCIHNNALGFLDRRYSYQMKSVPEIPEPIEKTVEPPSSLGYDQSSVEMDSSSNISLKIVKVEEETNYSVSESPNELEFEDAAGSSTTISVKDVCSMNIEPSANKRYCDIDEDKSFLLSLLPEMRELSGLQKMDFKIAVLNNLKIARYSGNN